MHAIASVKISRQPQEPLGYTHFVFTCGALHAVRDHMYSRLDSITSGAFGQLMFDEPLDTVLLGLLGDNYWGDNAAAVDSCVLLPGGSLGGA
jgi:hypothetical protein